MRTKYVRVFRVTVFDDDPPEDPPEDPPADPPPEGVKFTEAQQEHINTMMARDKRTFQQKIAKQVSDIDALKKQSTLTSKDRESLDQKVNTLQRDLSTRDELAARDKRAIENKHQHEMKKVSDDMEVVVKKYTSSMIARSISDASSANSGQNPAHFQAILGPMAKVVPPIDEKGVTIEGQPDTVMIEFPDKDKDGKDVVLNLSPNDAVKRMSELDEHLALFKSKGTGGVGGTNISASGVGRMSAAELAKSDPEAYRKARAAGELEY